MNEFDPTEFVRGLQQILVSDKKRIGFLFGAGTSVVKKTATSPTVPAVIAMTNQVVDILSKDNVLYKECFEELKKEVDLSQYNIERILSKLEQKNEVIGSGSLNGLNQEQLSNLIEDIKSQIRDMVSVHKKVIDDKEKLDMVQTDFSEWIAGNEGKYPVEIYTTNYDLLLEVGLEYHKVPYFTGFTGSYEPFFAPELVENFDFSASHTKLWKIHGSLGWYQNKENGFVIRRYPTDDDILIYPSHLKYNQSQKQPYTSLMDRLSSFLRKDDGVLFTCGYSFNDEHINERILSSLKTGTTSHVIGLLYDKQWNDFDKRYDFSLTEESSAFRFAKLSNKISIYGQRSAVIGRKLGQWKLRKEPSKDETPSINLYFDEDAPLHDGVAVGEKVPEGASLWSGCGEFTLCDFKSFVSFLNSMTPEKSR